MEPLRIYLFGGFLLERGGSVLPPLASRIARSLFAYLLMQKGRPVPRDLLAGTFWPDMPEGRARRRLSHVLWQIQDVVDDGGTSPLNVTADTVAFDTSTPYWLDVAEFDRIFDSLRLSDGEGSRVRRSDDIEALRTCSELYRGDFLAGYFDDWVVLEQEHYLRRYLVVLSRLVEAAKGQGDYESALDYARRITHHDPLREEAHQEVMRLCFLLGRTSEALQQFERCRSVLVEELGTEPSEPTVALYRRILRQRRATLVPAQGAEGGSLPPGKLQASFVGREEERRTLVDHLEQTLVGQGGAVLVEGEPGVGKTRLVLEAAEDARWRGFEVRWATCSQGTLRPFAPLAEILETLGPLRAEQILQEVGPVWLAEAARLAPRLGEELQLTSTSTPLRPTEESTRMQEALVLTLGALGKIAPNVLIVDDVHWADHDTLSVLAQLGSRLAATRTMLLMIYRSEEGRGNPEVWDVLRDLDRTAGLGRVVLSPLSVFELSDMVKRALSLNQLQPDVAAHLHHLTGGNALFALETLAALRDRGVFESEVDAAEVLQQQLAGRTIPLAPRVRSVVDARKSLLGQDASKVFEAVAVCGDAADLSVIAAAAGLARSRVLDALDELTRRDLVREENGSYRVAHDQVRQVVYETLDRRSRARLHRRVAEALLQAEHEDVDGLGHHFWQAGLPNEAARFLFKAGLRAVELNAFATARYHLDTASQAAARADWSPEDRYRVLAVLENVLNVLGRREEQEEAIEEMESLVETGTAGEGDLERRRAWLFAHTARFDQAERAAHRSVETARLNDRSELAASLVALGTVLRWSGRPMDAIPHLEAAVEAAEGDEQRRAEAATELGSTLVEVQRSPEALPHLAEASALFESLGDLRGEAEVAGIRARALRQEGDTDGAVAMYERAVELGRRIGYRYGEGVNLVNLGNLHHLYGRVADALAAYEQAARVFAELDDLRGEAVVLVNSASLRHTHLGDDDRAGRDVERARDHFAAIGDQGRRAQCLEVLAGVAGRRQRYNAARQMLEESLSGLASTGHRDLEVQHLRSLSLLHMGRGDHDEALATLGQAEELCDQAGLDQLAVELLSIRGTLLLATGREKEALAAARRAVQELAPGVERPHLVYHRHALVAQAAGYVREAAKAAAEAHRLLTSALEGLPERQRKRALEKVPEHREIEAMWERLSPQRVDMLLPVPEAPTGRPLRDEDLCRVTLTLEHPEDELVASPIDRRRRRLFRLVTEATRQGAVPSIAQLAELLDTSESTVRRDLAALRAQGHDLTTRGHRSRAS